MRIRAIVAGLSLLAGMMATAQQPLHQSTVRGFQSKIGLQAIVRDSAGALYVIYRDQFSPPQNDLAIGRSTDGGQTWNMLWQTGFVTLNPSDVGAIVPAIAIDSQNNLHCTWIHQATTGGRPPRTVRYNRFDAQTQAWGTEVTLGTSVVYEKPEGCLVVDGQDYVWASYGTTGWNSTVVRSDLPTASNGSFSPTTPAITTAGSAQNPSLVVDALGRVHFTYYATANGATVHHQWFDPAAVNPGWSTPVPLGNANAEADYYSKMCADAAGNVYCVYGIDVQFGKTGDPEWFVRQWDSQSMAWQPAVSFHKVTRTVYEDGGTPNDGRVVSCVCDETTGEVYILYRDFTAGRLLLGRWQAGESAITTYGLVATTGNLPGNWQNYFLYPQLRGSLNPPANRASAGIDLLFTYGDQKVVSPIYTLGYDRFPVASLGSSGTPKIGTSYVMNLSAVADGNLGYVAAACLGGFTPGIPIDRRFVPLVTDGLFFATAQNFLPAIFANFQGQLSAAGTATCRFNIPNLGAIVGLPVYFCYLTFPGGPVGVKSISNPHTVVITS